MSCKFRSIIQTVVVLGGMWAGASHAGQPDFAAEKGNKGRVVEDRSRGTSVTISFGEQQRLAVRQYYADQYKSGRCPPGLAKKNNGCQPPGQAKKWTRGKPLPRDVVYYEVPPALVVKLGVPPAGQKYVRVAGDILLIAIGTAMVIDAIEDLGR